MIGTNHTNLNESRVTGTDINYYFVCLRKLWLFSHGIGMEQTSEKVDYGNFVHENSYKNNNKREYNIDNLISIDMCDSRNVVHEIKLSKAFEKASIYQLLYYLYILKERGIIKTGEINYPLLKKTEKIELTLELEEELKDIIKKVRIIKSSEECPIICHLSYLCKKCSYYDFCYG